MADDNDETRRAELARLGIARSGIARVGVARLGYAPTAEEVLQRVLAEHAEFRKRLEAVEAKQAALKPKRRKGQRKTTQKKQDAAAAFAQRVDRERAKSDEVNLNDAIEAVLKKTVVRKRLSKRSRKTHLVDWLDLTPSQRIVARRAARARYYRGKRNLGKNRSTR